MASLNHTLPNHNKLFLHQIAGQTIKNRIYEDSQEVTKEQTLPMQEIEQKETVSHQKALQENINPLSTRCKERN